MKSMVPTIDLSHIRGNTSPRVPQSRKGSSNVFWKCEEFEWILHQYARFRFSYTLSFKDALTSCPIAAPGTRCLEGSGESQIADHNITTISSKTTGMNPYDITQETWHTSHWTCGFSSKSAKLPLMKMLSHFRSLWITGSARVCK